MRYIIGGTVALALHAALHTRTGQRALNWIFTTDVRHTDPHLYGRGRA